MPAQAFDKEREDVARRVRCILRYTASLLLLVLFAAACADDDAPASDADEVTTATFRMSWVIAGNYAPFFLAQERGYYAECGLNPVIRRGTGSGDAAQLVGTGADDLGFVDAVAIVPARVQGLPIISVGGVYQSNPSSLVSKAEAGITEPEDLAGKEFGAVPGGSPYLLYRAFLEHQGIDPNDIREISVPAPGIAQLLTDQVDFITFYGSEVATIDPNPDENLNILSFSDHGFDLYSQMLVTNETFLEENPDAVQCWVDGSHRGLIEAREDPDAAMAALLEAAPELREQEEVHEQLLEAIWPLVGDEPLIQTEERWEQTQTILYDAGIVEETVGPSELFTNEFLP